jgi:hypothetical protein
LAPQHETTPAGAADTEQLCSNPVATAISPELAAAGTDDWLRQLEPQHATTPSADSAHVCRWPAASATWSAPAAAGTVAWPNALLPQHATAPPADSAHVW